MQDWNEMEIDERLLKALKDLNYQKPTLIQNTCIPLGLKGKSLRIKGSTGSGKSLCFLIPVISRLISSRESKCLILLPTKELCFQILSLLQDLLKYFIQDSRLEILNLNALKEQVSEKDVGNSRIIIGTPTRFLKEFTMIQDLKILVVDEVDLLKSFGYEEELKEILNGNLKQVEQIFTCSATLSKDFNDKGILVELKEEAKITQFYLKLTEFEKFLILMVIVKLRISPIYGKIIVFTNTKEKCYKIKLFLEQFGIKSATLNSDLPIESRVHIVEEFNRGIYDFLIATDESLQEKSSKKYKGKGDLEYGVCRGIDFKNVRSIVNFDLPKSFKSYSHRIGRTGRGDNRGYSLTFYTPGEHVSGKKDIKISQDRVFTKIEKLSKGNSFFLINRRWKYTR
jgi:ATP-dependent RNA helicase DDX56/DBP9